MAWSQDSRVHSPLTSFIGYFSRRSPCTSSRTEAPLAQCERRLRTPEARPAATPCKRARPADPSLRLINMCVIPSVAVDAIVVLDVIGFLVAGLDALGLRLIRRGLTTGQRHHRRRRDRRSA